MCNKYKRVHSLSRLSLHKPKPYYVCKLEAVLKSCITLEQLRNAIMWIGTVSKHMDIALYDLGCIMQVYRAKRQQIKNGLATKYN